MEHKQKQRNAQFLRGWPHSHSSWQSYHLTKRHHLPPTSFGSLLHSYHKQQAESKAVRQVSATNCKRSEIPPRLLSAKVEQIVFLFCFVGGLLVHSNENVKKRERPSAPYTYSYWAFTSIWKVQLSENDMSWFLWFRGLVTFLISMLKRF